MAQRKEVRQRRPCKKEREYFYQPKVIKRDRKYDDGRERGRRPSTIKHGRRRKERRDSRREVAEAYAVDITSLYKNSEPA